MSEWRKRYALRVLHGVVAYCTLIYQWDHEVPGKPLFGPNKNGECWFDQTNERQLIWVHLSDQPPGNFLKMKLFVGGQALGFCKVHKEFNCKRDNTNKDELNWLSLAEPPPEVKEKQNKNNVNCIKHVLN